MHIPRFVLSVGDVAGAMGNREVSVVYGSQAEVAQLDEVLAQSDLMDQLPLVDKLFHARHCFFLWQNSRNLSVG